MRRTVTALVSSFALVAGGLAGGLVGGLGAAVAAASPAAAAPPAFFIVGTHTWTVPDGVTTATFDLLGAGGGNGGWDPSSGFDGSTDGTPGRGGETRVTLQVNPGDTYTLDVGGAGGDAIVATGHGGAGGFNGGGAGGNVDNSRYHELGGGGGGGGASDVVLNGKTILEAGGGGGGGGAGGFATRTAWCKDTRIGAGPGGGGGGRTADRGSDGPRGGGLEGGTGGYGGNLFTVSDLGRRFTGGAGGSSGSGVAGGGGGGGWDAGSGGSQGYDGDASLCIDHDQVIPAISPGGGGGGGSGYAPENGSLVLNNGTQWGVMQNSVNSANGAIYIVPGTGTVPNLTAGTFADFRYPTDPTHFVYGEMVDASFASDIPLVGGYLIYVDGGVVGNGTIDGSDLTEYNGIPVTRLQVGLFQPGHHVLQIEYVGDSIQQTPNATNAVAFSNPVGFDIDPAPPFVVTLTTSPNPSSQFGGGFLMQLVQSSGLSGGRVTFEVDGHIAEPILTLPPDPPVLCVNLEPNPLDHSRYSCISREVLSPGRHVVTAHFGGTAVEHPADVSVIQYVAGAVTGIEVDAPSTATAGSPFDVTVRAVDANGTTVPNFTGTVHLASSDPNAVLPADYTFTSDDAGTHTFSAGASLTDANDAADTITATSGARQDSASVAVSPGALDHLVVAGDADEVAPGGSVTFTATGDDAYNNPIGDVTGDTTFTVDGAPCSGNVCSSSTPGEHTVAGTDAGATGSATFAVDAPVVDHIVVSPADVSISAGGSQAYTVEAFDASNNDLGDVTASSTFRITPDGSCAGATCTATTAGDHTVAITYSALTANATLHVAPGPLVQLAVTPANATSAAGAAKTFTAKGVDAYGNPVAGLTPVFSVTPEGSCTGATCRAFVAGTHTVTAKAGLLSATTSWKINPAAAAVLQLTPLSTSIKHGVRKAFRAVALDRFGNAIKDVTSTTTFKISPNGSCLKNACTSSKFGLHLVIATRGALGGLALLKIT